MNLRTLLRMTDHALMLAERTRAEMDVTGTLLMDQATAAITTPLIGLPGMPAAYAEVA